MFTIIIWNSFSGRFPISSSFLWFGGHLSCSLMAGFPGGAEVKVSACNVGNLGSIPGSGRSPGEGNGNPFQYSYLENPMDREEPSGLQPMGSQRIRHD